MMNNKTTNIEKVVYLDMDGTLFSLYTQIGWLDALRAEEPIFENLPFMDGLTSEAINRKIIALQKRGWKVAIITWCPMNCSESYFKACSDEKLACIERELPTIQEVHILPYGVNKSEVINKNAINILFDDNKDIRDMWEGIAFSHEDLLTKMTNLLFLPL